MIQVLLQNEIDKEKWDSCILKSNGSNIYGLYDAVCIACENWRGIIYNDYEAVVVLPVKKKMGLVYSWHPQFMGPLGVFTNQKKREAIKEMLAELSKYSWWIKMYYWQKEGIKGFNITEKVYQELEIGNKNIELIRLGYNQNTKRNYKKAAKLDLAIQPITDVDLVINSFKKNKGSQIENINDASYKLLKKLMNHWMENGSGHITAIYDGDALAAIGYFLVHRETITYYKGVVTDTGKSNGAMHFLIDHEIESHLKQCKYFDFGGSNSESVARFYKGFGGIDRRYYLYEYKKLPI